MMCTICNVYDKPPVQATGAWVARLINNWVKAKSLLIQHERSEIGIEQPYTIIVEEDHHQSQC